MAPVCNAPIAVDPAIHRASAFLYIVTVPFDDVCAFVFLRWRRFGQSKAECFMKAADPRAQPAAVMDPDQSFVALGLGLRAELAAILTGVAGDWIDAPGLEATGGATGPAAPLAGWHVESSRAPGDPFRLRAVIAETLPSAAFVAAAFRAVLGRAPDRDGLAQYSAGLDRDPAGRRILLEILAASSEAANRPERFRFRRVRGKGGRS